MTPVSTLRFALRLASLIKKFVTQRLTGGAKFARANGQTGTKMLLAMLALAASALGQIGTPALFQQVGSKLVGTGVSSFANQAISVPRARR